MISESDSLTAGWLQSATPVLWGSNNMLTRRQIEILKMLADGWVMDRTGKDGLSAILTGKKGQSASISRSTVSTLLGEGVIETACNDVTDFKISSVGRNVLECVAAQSVKQVLN